jgi:hypothetical protein
VKCNVCKNNIPAGAAATKMIVEYAQPDGRTLIFGYMMPDGPLTAATGRILRGWHGKCYWAARKREARGDAVTGRILIGGPTAYELSALVHPRDETDNPDNPVLSTAFISERLQNLRTLARRIGKGVGDATVLEAFWAQEHNGPYPHTHHLPLDAYQLHAHLRYAHGTTDYVTTRTTHDLLHARMSQQQVDATRAADPTYAPTAESDWRSQVVEDVENLT